MSFNNCLFVHGPSSLALWNIIFKCTILAVQIWLWTERSSCKDSKNSLPPTSSFSPFTSGPTNTFGTFHSLRFCFTIYNTYETLSLALIWYILPGTCRGGQWRLRLWSVRPPPALPGQKDITHRRLTNWARTKDASLHSSLSWYMPWSSCSEHLQPLRLSDMLSRTNFWSQ